MFLFFFKIFGPNNLFSKEHNKCWNLSHFLESVWILIMTRPYSIEFHFTFFKIMIIRGTVSFLCNRVYCYERDSDHLWIHNYFGQYNLNSEVSLKTYQERHYSLRPVLFIFIKSVLQPTELMCNVLIYSQ